MLGFASPQELALHYEHVSNFDVSAVYLFERSAAKAERGENGKPEAVTRAWDRIQSFVVRMYPPVPKKDYYFVNINTFRRIEKTSVGMQSFFRMMRRAGLLPPARSADAVSRYWRACLEEVRAALGIALGLSEVKTSPSAPVSPAPIYFPPLEPLDLSALAPSPVSESEVSLPTPDSVPEPVAEMFDTNPELFCPASADEAMLSPPTSEEAREEAPLAAPATPMYGVHDDWSDSLTDVLSHTSSEELTDICRDLASVISDEVLI